MALPPEMGSYAQDFIGVKRQWFHCLNRPRYHEKAVSLFPFIFANSPNSASF